MRISDWSSDVCASDLLRCVGHALGAHAGQNRAGARCRHQAVAPGTQRVLPEAAAILQAEGEAAGGAEALDRRRRQREGEAVLDLHEPAVHPPGDSACGILGAALAPVLQSDEGEAGILAGAGEAEARSEEHTSEIQSLMRISYAVFCLKKKKER